MQEPMNEDTLSAVCCYRGDAHQVKRAMPWYVHHNIPVVILSPANSKVSAYLGAEARHFGKAAYIGQPSLVRQLGYFEILLKYPQRYFLIHDSDSLCLSPELPRELYADDNVVWSNEVTEPRPHESPYPKIAMQPSYFISRSAMERMLEVGRKIETHPITPYVDWFMMAMTAEAGLTNRAFTTLEHPPRTEQPQTPPPSTHPWAQLSYRIHFCGTIFVHPIKTEDQLRLCVESYQNRRK